MRYYLLFLAWCVIGISFSLAQGFTSAEETIDPAKDALKVAGTLPKILKEASGLEVTRSGWLWTHNDDRYSILYALDTLGNILKAVHLNHPNIGWEDLTQDASGNLYIGAFGNNKNDRQNLVIYKIPDPEGISEKVVNAQQIEFEYSDQQAFPPPPSHRNFDVDAFTSIGDSLFLFTKNRTEPFTGYTKVYRLPQEPGRYTAVLCDSIYLGNGPMMDYWITSADISPDGKRLILLSHNCLWIISDFGNKPFSAGKIIKVNLHHFSHKAGLAFVSETKLYLLDELEFGFLGGKIYSIDMEPIFEKFHAGATAAREKVQRPPGGKP